MGFISQLTGYESKARVYPPQPWDGIFSVSKESGKTALRLSDNPTQGSGWGRSAVNVNSFARLLEAYRSKGPGGWTDDRWEESRHYTGIAYVAIHRANEQLMQSEFQVFEKDDNAPDGKKPVSRHHPGYELVKMLERPNGEDCFGDMMAQWNLQMDLTGTALTWLVPNRLGKPFEMYSIPTAAAMPSPIVNPDFPDGYYRIQPLYPYGPFSAPTPFSAAGAIIPAKWMIRFKYPHPYVRHDGYSPLTGMRSTLDVVEAIYRSRWYSMSRGVNPTAILNFDEVDGMQGLPPEEIARIHAEWEGNFQGAENHGKLIIGHPGSRLDPFGNKPVDMDYPAGWEQETGFALAGFGISKPAAGMTEDASYGALFATLKQFHLLTLQPKCVRIGSKLTRELGKYFGDDLIVEVRCPRIDDHDIKFEKVKIAQGAGAITYNQLLKELDFPMTDEEWGEQRVGKDEQQGQQPGAPGGMPEMPGQEQPPMPGQEPPQDETGEEETDDFDGSKDQSLEEELNAIDAELNPEEATPGNMGKDSLGPRKMYEQRRIDVLRKALKPPKMKALVSKGQEEENYVERLIRLSNNGDGHAD